MSRTRSFSRLLLVGLVLGSRMLAAPTVSHAQTAASETARVTELFKSGKAAFAKGDMAEAERLFGDALAMRKSSDIAANLAQSQLEQQKYRKAAENFAWALANLLPSATDAQRKAVETGLGRARAEVAVLRLEIAPEGSDVLVGEQNLGKSPVVSGVYVDPGEIIVSVKHDGFVAIDKRLMVGKGTEQAVEIRLTPKDDAPAAVAATPAVDSGLRASGTGADDNVDRSKPKSLAPALIATGLAVAGGVVGLVFTLKANSKSDDASKLLATVHDSGDDCTAPIPAAIATECAALPDKLKSKDSATNLAIGAFVVGGVAALAAGYFYWDASSHRASRTAGGGTLVGGLKPSLDIGRARASEPLSLGSVKLSLSGNF